MRLMSSMNASLAMLKETLAAIIWTVENAVSRRSAMLAGVFVSLHGVTAMFIVASAYFVSQAVGAASASDRNAMRYAVLGCAISALALRGLHLVRGIVWERLYADCMPELYANVLQYFLEKPLGQIEHNASTLNHASIERGHGRAVLILETLAYSVFPVVFEVAIGLLGLIIVAPSVGLMTLAVITLHIGSSVFLNRYIIERMDPIEREHRAFNYAWVETMEKVVHTATMGARQRERERLRALHESVNEKDRAVWVRFHTLICLRDAVTLTLGMLGVSIWVVFEVYAKAIAVADTVALFMWFGLVSGALGRWSDIERNLLDASARVSVMTETLTQRPWFSLDAGASFKRNGPAAVRCENLGYRYPGSSKEAAPVLKGVTLDIQAGTSVALLGETGAGKSSLMKLMLGYDRPASGRVLINGRDLSELSLADYYRLVSFVPQYPDFADGTLRQNLLFGLPLCEREEWADERLWELVRELQVDFGESRLDRGLDTKIGRDGLQLSGGQRQRLALAKAIIRQPRLLVIDEGTSSLDSGTEKLVVEGIRRATRGVTSIIIAHRLASVGHCDRFVFLRRADTLTEGESQVGAVACSLSELAALVPEFRELAKLQGLDL